MDSEGKRSEGCTVFSDTDYESDTVLWTSSKR